MRLSNLKFSEEDKLILNLLSRRVTVQEVVIDEPYNFLNTVNEHRCAALVYKEFNRIKTKNNVVARTQELLKNKCRDSFACSLLLNREINQVQRKLEENEINHIYLKGFSLARLAYESLFDRPSVDVDIFIQKKDYLKVISILESVGFYLPTKKILSTIRSQYTLVKKVTASYSVYLDIHFEISNDIRVNQNISFIDFYEKSERRNIGGVNFLLNGLSFSFIHSCFHLAKHFNQGDNIRIIWLYDIYLISESDNFNVQETITLTIQKQMSLVVSEVVQLVSIHLPFTDKSKQLLDGLKSKNENNFEYLIYKSERYINIIIRQFLSNEGFRKKLIFIKETIFPSKEHIKNKYNLESEEYICYFYLKRVITGLVKWFKKR